MTRHQLNESPAEHIADGVLHVIGVAASIAGVTGLMVWAAMRLPGAAIWPLAIYAAGLVISFSLSAAYNMTLHAPTRAVLRRLDHAAIYLLIAGTYTPMALIGLGGPAGWALAVTAWALAAVGIVMKLVFFHRWQQAGFLLYLGLGWLGAVAAWPLMATLSLAALSLIVIGGLTYTVGTIFFHSERKYARAIWHGHVLAGAVVHYAAVLVVAIGLG
ncbi:PAQR family membrane homeostasis protein TrhA [Rhodalgimonas zhirmunskyi]|uniref:Hemolysin III family protein n=1 Tax=Rhodalgimonas zhirmunskyi TaxID=2964767 RepID=A0AAJ1UGK7_9RHOB|nr:hemolysin III family protein [Rhodoalgimonas zhirmunskyi]MDQ2095787.1 hemolysin III family protein [Rhodoalgimonas zhirmunskyi]